MRLCACACVCLRKFMLDGTKAFKTLSQNQNTETIELSKVIHALFLDTI